MNTDLDNSRNVPIILYCNSTSANGVEDFMNRLITLVMISLPIVTRAQQVADISYNPPIHSPAYPVGQGPIVFIDEGHYNFHTKEGRYKAFANLLERDGYQVKRFEGVFNKNKLSKGKIMVISNALNEINVKGWYLPNPSAFTSSEIKALKDWVNKGGSLFLIADHMPMAGAAADLAAEFGFEFTNGFVIGKVKRGPAFFRQKDKTLSDNTITQGRNAKESVQKIATFTGQAFRLPKDAIPILTFDDAYINLLPDTAWVFNETTVSQEVKGWSQGAYKKYGQGKLVVFGEAAMFSAQLAGPDQRKMGMNNSVATENYQLLLNVIHWLDGKLD